MKSLFGETPLFNRFLTSLPNSILKNTFLLCCQHLLKDTRLLLLSLQELGLKRDNIAIIGKCYSTNTEVVSSMEADGFDVFIPKIDFDSHISFDDQFKKHIKLFVKAHEYKISQLPFQHIIVLDDGGELITTVHELFKDVKNIIGIEQTSSGFNKIKQMEGIFPIINVARCQAKLNHESPIIAQTILRQLKIHLKDHSFTQKNALILGNGAIGKAISRQLQFYCSHTKIYDLDTNRSELNQDEFISYLGQADIILGCTGLTSIKHSFHKFLKKEAVLASASSSDREFDAVYLRKTQEKTFNCHKNMVFQNIHLLNCGFPINFSGRAESTPLPKRQLVMSLLLAALCQAKKTDYLDKGIIHLNEKYENYIIQIYRKSHTNPHLERTSIKSVPNFYQLPNKLERYATINL